MLQRVPRNLIILAVAAVFGLGAAWLAARYLEERATEIERRQLGQMGRAVVAKTDLAVGTPLTHDLVAVREVPVEWLHSSAITPEQFGLPVYTLEDLQGGTPEENAQISLDLLQGQKGAHRDIVVLNAAATIYIGQKASSLEEAVRIAAETIDSGKAFAKLEEIRAYTNRDDIKSL